MYVPLPLRDPIPPPTSPSPGMAASLPGSPGGEGHKPPAAGSQAGRGAGSQAGRQAGRKAAGRQTGRLAGRHEERQAGKKVGT